MLVAVIKKITIFVLISFLCISSANSSEFPNTSIAIVDLNLLLSDSKVAINADEQIEKIGSAVHEELAKEEQLILDMQRELIEAQKIMAPEAFEEKRINYEKSVQDFQIRSQDTLVKLDRMIAIVRSQILDEVQPILENIAKEKGITVILEKGNVILNANNMDITKLVLKQLDKNLPKIKVELEE